MYATNTKQCHFVCWTPRRTVVYLIERDEDFIQELLIQLKGFWNKAQLEEIPTWNINLEILQTKAKKISECSLLIKTLSSCRKENAMQHEFQSFLEKK